MYRFSVFLHMFALAFISLVHPNAVLVFVKAAVDEMGGYEALERAIKYSRMSGK